LKEEETNFQKLPESHNGVMMFDNTYSGLLQQIRNHLNGIGSPVNYIQPSNAKDYREKYSINMAPLPFDQVLNFCDSFSLAKMIIKTNCISNDTDVSFSPEDDKFSSEVDLQLSLTEQGASLPLEKLLGMIQRDQVLFNPSLNSLRKT